MQPGSLVVVKPIPKDRIRTDIDIKWLPKDGEQTIYLVREIHEGKPSGEPAVMLEEGIVGYNKLGMEIGINQSLLREVEPPRDITNMIKELIDEPIAL